MGAVHIGYTDENSSYLFTGDTILPIDEYIVDPLDMTYELTFGTAYQNSNLPPIYYNFYNEQLDTMDETSTAIWSYDLILDGHTLPLDPNQASGYIYATVMTFGYFPYL